jgi:lactate dehydrogenase-like 2-hydroxyacid dehydrogenase
VDESALAEALRHGKLVVAGIDVPRSHDKIETFAELFEGIENVILTPHVASGTYNCANLFWEQAADNICKAVRGEKPKNLVNDVWN